MTVPYALARAVVHHAAQHEEHTAVQRRYADSGDVFGRRGYRRAGGLPQLRTNSVDTIVSHLSDVGTVRYEMGYAAAISVFLFAMMAVTRVVVGKIMDSLGK